MSRFKRRVLLYSLVASDCDFAVDAFVLAVGTGGTITGVGEAFNAGQHQIPGIGVGFVPGVLNRAILDEIIAIPNEDVFAGATTRP